MADRTDDRSLGDLFSELSRETSALIQKEMELAKTEMSAKLTTAKFSNSPSSRISSARISTRLKKRSATAS